MKVHTWLRAELDGVRDATPSGKEASIDRQLQARCLAFCASLDAHHTGEDDGIFPHLENEYPGLAPALQKMREEHRVVARILRDVQDVLDRSSAGEDIRTRLDELSVELDSHFDYEEEQIVGVLNQIRTRPWD